MRNKFGAFYPGVIAGWEALLWEWGCWWGKIIFKAGFFYWKVFLGGKVPSKKSDFDCLSAIWLTEQILIKGYSDFRLLFTITRLHCLNFTYFDSTEVMNQPGDSFNFYWILFWTNIYWTGKIKVTFSLRWYIGVWLHFFKTSLC